MMSASKRSADGLSNRPEKMAKTHFDRPAATQEVLATIATAFNDQSSFPDITITRHDTTWYCHKVILCGRSEWFRKACSGQFKEGGAATIAFEEDDQEILEATLRYCYTVDLGADNERSALFYVKVFALAEKYFVRGLTKFATDCFASAIRKTDRKDEDLCAAIQEAYTNTSDVDRLLRNTITEYFGQNSGELMSGDHEKFFYQIIEGVPELAMDIIKMTLSEDYERRVEGQARPASHSRGWYKCPSSCSGTTYSGLIMNGSEGSEYKLKCSKCGKEGKNTGRGWKVWYSG